MAGHQILCQSNLDYLDEYISENFPNDFDKIKNFEDACKKYILKISDVEQALFEAMVNVKKTNIYNFMIEVPVMDNEAKTQLMDTQLSSMTNELINNEFVVFCELKKKSQNNLMLRLGYRILDINYVEYNQYEFDIDDLDVFMRYLALNICIVDGDKWPNLRQKLKSLGIGFRLNE